MNYPMFMADDGQHAGGRYEIHVVGHLGATWQAWFEGVRLWSVQDENGRQERTILTVPDDDSAILYGVLAQIGALNLRLIAVELRPSWG